jgi:hypothetical protein
MKVMMLDTMNVIDLPHREACAAIDARVAVEAPVESNLPNSPAPLPESAMLDRAAQTMIKPRPQPRPTPREKRRKKR